MERAMAERGVPEAELDVLTVLNRLGQASARELRDALHERRPMAHGSVLTLLGRLEAKGMVSRDKAVTGKAFIYSATASGRGAHGSAVRNMVDRVFGGSSVSLVATLLEEHPPSAAELDEMQQLLADLRRQKNEKGRR
jgi:predicted transcriptional regulator